MSFRVKCAGCNMIIKLLKDSTEGQKVWCGKCWSRKLKREKKND